MANNKGKIFEQDVSNSCKKDNIFCLRLHDTSLGWSHLQNSSYTPNNPCDFLLFQYPYLYAIECKSTKYKSISIQRGSEDAGMIKAHQINSLITFSNVKGIYAGFLLNFRDEEKGIDDITYWLPVQNFSNFLYENDKQSINRLDIINYGGIIVPQKKLRTHYKYDIEQMMKIIVKQEENNGTSI